MHLPPAIFVPAAACVAACLAAAVSAWGVFLVRGSTAVPAAFWSVAACLALAWEMGAKAAGGLADPALQTLILMVLAGGADVRRALS
jgi:hypothetical protein